MRVLVTIGLLFGLGCEGAHTKRDIKSPAHEMTYDDACGLQDYFDERQASSIPPPRAADETIATSEEGKAAGEGSYKLDPMARRRFARMLREEYWGVETKYLHSIESGDGDVLVHVRWWDAGGIRRLHPDAKITVTMSAGTSSCRRTCASPTYSSARRSTRNAPHISATRPTARSASEADLRRT